jgi:hypothetical protein
MFFFLMLNRLSGAIDTHYINILRLYLKNIKTPFYRELIAQFRL